MKLHRVYQIIVNEVIYDMSSSLSQIMKSFDEIKKVEPSAYIVTYYA